MALFFTALIVVLVTVGAVQWLNAQDNPKLQKLLDWFPAILFAYVIPAAFTHGTGLDLSKVFLHTLSKEWIIPITILAVMSALSVQQLKIIGFKPILLFVGGSFVIATLPAVLVLSSQVMGSATHDLMIGEKYWQGLVPIVGSWIGGSTSQLVLKELSGCSEALFLSILVLDNILVNIWTILMFQCIKRSDQLNGLFKISDQIQDFVPDAPPADQVLYSPPFTGVILSAIVVACNLLISSFLAKIVILSFVGLALGNLISQWNHSFVLKLSGHLIITIMAILGLKLNFAGMSMPLLLIGFVIIWLLLHFVSMVGLAKFLNLHMAWVPIASMANLGGISTAPAVTAAYNEEWMPHAIVLAILSMVSGTAWGMYTIYLFGLF